MEARNGYFKLDMREAGVFLIVHPPQGDGEPVNLKEIMAYLEIGRASCRERV